MEDKQGFRETHYVSVARVYGRRIYLLYQYQQITPLRVAVGDQSHAGVYMEPQHLGVPQSNFNQESKISWPSLPLLPLAN